MTPGSQARVGAVIIGALALLGLGIYFVLGWGSARSRYLIRVTFPEARLQAGDDVRMVGVIIGAVDDVNLTPDQRAAIVTLSIDRKYKIRSNYRVRVASSVALENHWVEIEPVRPGGVALKPGAVMRGARATELRDVIEQANEALLQLTQTARHANRVLGDEELIASVRAAVDRLANVADQAANLAASLSAVPRRLEPRVEKAIGAAEKALLEIASTARAARDSLSTSDIKQAQANAARALDDADKLVRQVDLAVQDLRKIVGQPGLPEDVQAVVKHAGDALQSIKVAADSIKDAADSVKQAAGTVGQAGKVVEKVSRLGAIKRPGASGALSFEYLTHRRDAWIEGNVNLDFGSRTMRLGLADIGGADRFNLQLGAERGPGLLRAGLIQSELGLGYDIALSRRLSLSADLFDPHDTRLNLLGYYSLSGGYDLVLGGRNLGHDSDLSLGVRVTK